MKYKLFLYCFMVITVASITSVHGAPGDVPSGPENGAQNVLSEQSKEKSSPAVALPASSSIKINGLSKKEKIPLDILPHQAYKIGAGDVLSISVWKDAELSREVVVLPDGSISLPLIGQLIAAGNTVAELEEEIVARIKRFLPDPVLDVSVSHVNSMVIYIIGKVRSPGRYPVQADINVLQALAIAGGLDKHADEDSIKIFREENGQTRLFNFEYDEVTDGDKLEQNIRLQRGDVVVVP